MLSHACRGKNKVKVLNDHGQLLLPILGVLFLFGVFFVPYALWCKKMYWKMRMDAAADLVALSAARQKAAQLNFMATLQSLQTPFVPRFGSRGATSISQKKNFEFFNNQLVRSAKQFPILVGRVSSDVARLNGGSGAVLPLGFSLRENLSSRLKANPLKVAYVVPSAPPAILLWHYRAGYYTREWSPRKVKAQPDHRNDWRVCRGTICGEGRAMLWLDVDPTSVLNNGGFPSANATWLGRLGFQCFYPQFNARLLPKR
jgi:hypothetical protein